jgi:hypothetical protein
MFVLLGARVESIRKIDLPPLYTMFYVLSPSLWLCYVRREGDAPFLWLEKNTRTDERERYYNWKGLFVISFNFLAAIWMEVTPRKVQVEIKGHKVLKTITFSRPAAAAGVIIPLQSLCFA